MIQLKSHGLLAALIVLVAATETQASPIARLTLQSQPGDSIGQGQDFDLTYVEGKGVARAFVTDLQGTLIPVFVRFFLEDQSSNNVADVEFGGVDPVGPLQPGTYTNAVDASRPMVGHPGLLVNFQNRGCFSVAGNFVVTDATFLPDGTLSSFAASFEQHCGDLTGDPATAPALFGTFNYNANATEIPEPAAYALVVIGIVWLSFRLFQRRSWPIGIKGTTYRPQRPTWHCWMHRRSKESPHLRVQARSSKSNSAFTGTRSRLAMWSMVSKEGALMPRSIRSHQFTRRGRSSRLCEQFSFTA